MFFSNKKGEEGKRGKVDDAFDRLSDGRIGWDAERFQVFVPIVHGLGKVRNYVYEFVCLRFNFTSSGIDKKDEIPSKTLITIKGKTIFTRFTLIVFSIKFDWLG